MIYDCAMYNVCTYQCPTERNVRFEWDLQLMLVDCSVLVTDDSAATVDTPKRDSALVWSQAYQL